MKKFEYFKPETLKEASELLVKYGEGAHILNGGTDLVVRMRENHLAPEAVIDIKGIKELYNLSYDEE
ncbi:MAG: FAD binding domain-containing protein, partial [Clostridiaceae bacterium]|nr:FAD binding domain-containing protein [Clostridiaceae bacterium]